jgi:hypothetical protein
MHRAYPLWLGELLAVLAGTPIISWGISTFGCRRQWKDYKYVRSKEVWTYLLLQSLISRCPGELSLLSCQRCKEPPPSDLTGPGPRLGRNPTRNLNIVSSKIENPRDHLIYNVDLFISKRIDTVLRYCLSDILCRALQVPEHSELCREHALLKRIDSLLPWGLHDVVRRS